MSDEQVNLTTFPNEPKFNHDQQIKDLIATAERDKDDVSCFFYGSQEQGVEGAVMVVKGGEYAEQIFKWLEMQGLTSRTPIV